MNYDSFYDSVKSIGDLTFGHQNGDHMIMMPFVADIKKVHLLVEREEVFMEGTHLEVEGKSILVFDEPFVDLPFTKNLKTLFGALLVQTSPTTGRLSISKIGCPVLDTPPDAKEHILNFLEEAKQELEKRTIDLIIKTSGHMDVSFTDTMTYLNDGITYFGKIFLVKEVMKTLELSRSLLVDNMCNKADLESFFNRFIEAVEVYYTALSTANLAQINKNGS